MSPRTSLAVVANPASGNGRAAIRLAAAKARWRVRGIDFVELIGSSAEDSRRLAVEAVMSGVDAVVAVGGDGLINTVLQATALTEIPLGIIAGGTGNDLVRELGLPNDPVAAADVVVDGDVRRIDLGRVDGGDLRTNNLGWVAGERGRTSWFATVMSSGFDSRVTNRANRMRWPRGPMRYNLAMIAELARLEPVRYRIELDDKVIDVEATMAAVGNGRSYGGGMLICPDAQLDDGMLDLTVVGPTSRTKLLRMMPTVYRGTHVDVEGVTTYRSTRIRLSVMDWSELGLSGEGITADADGEPLGPLPVTAVAVFGAGKVIV